MKKSIGIIGAVTVPLLAAGSAIAYAGKQLFVFSIQRDNSSSIMNKLGSASVEDRKKAKEEKKKLKRAGKQAGEETNQEKENIQEQEADKEQNTVEETLNADVTDSTETATEEMAPEFDENGVRIITGALYDRIAKGGLQWFLNQNPEEVTIESYDWLKLSGWFLANKDENGNVSKKTMLLMHGYRCQMPFDLGHTYKHFYEAGYNLMIPQQRSHGKSEGGHICYGTKERFDVQKWCEYLVEKVGEDQEINLMGISMGAATVLMSTGLDLPKQVNKVIADCGFTSPKAEFEACLNGYGIKKGKNLFLKAAEIWAKSDADFRFEDYSTLDAMKVNTHPILFIHGDADDFVPTRFTTENYEACQAPKKVLYVKGAKHATSGLVDPEAYFRAIDEFLIDSYSTIG